LARRAGGRVLYELDAQQGALLRCVKGNFDEDGDDELLLRLVQAPAAASGTVTVLELDGQRSSHASSLFQQQSPTAPFADISTIAWDYNGDGIDELLQDHSTRAARKTVAYLLDGKKIGALPVGIYSRHALGDFDGNGRQDLLGVVSDLNPAKYVAYGAGGTELLEVSALAFVDAGSGPLLVADPDRDGRDEVLVLEDFKEGFKALGIGTEQPLAGAPASIDDPFTFLAAQDIDGNGTLELYGPYQGGSFEDFSRKLVCWDCAAAKEELIPFPAGIEPGSLGTLNLTPLPEQRALLFSDYDGGIAIYSAAGWGYQAQLDSVSLGDGFFEVMHGGRPYLVALTANQVLVYP
jgi:hypothetical protein